MGVDFFRIQCYGFNNESLLVAIVHSLQSYLEKTVLSSLEAAAVKPEDTLLAAVSGGADSTALLASLAALRGEGGEGGGCLRFRLCALHVDHALRGEESRADAASVAALCDNLDVPCRVVTAPDGFIQEEARRRGNGI
jgi:tRNA(Ile)-lysidine synthase